MRKKVGIFFIFAILLLIPQFNNLDGFLQRGTKIELQLEPGDSETVQWGLYTEKDIPVELKLRAEGKGAELLSFPTLILAEPDTWYNVDITITVPEDYPNDVFLEPSVIALMAAPAKEQEGALRINLQMMTTMALSIGNPVIEEIPVEEKSPKNTEEEPIEEKMEKPQDSGVFTLDAPKEQEQGGGCLISTATYGSELAPQVQLLREIRDNKLLSTNSGYSFMTGFNSIYYSFSPTIADWERQSPIFKEVVKLTLTPLITSLSILNYIDINSEIEVLGYGISLILLNIGMYFVAPAILISRLCRKN